MRDLGDYVKVGDAWIAGLRAIANDGCVVTDRDEIYRELKSIVFSTKHDFCDFILDSYARSKDIFWMKKNFTSFDTVYELKDARSYASRLFSYGGLKNQLDWVIKKLNINVNTRSATITMLEPLTDELYIPCISMLDFDISDNKLNVYVYARALDFGGKAYANMLCVWDILKYVASCIDMEIGQMIWICKSIHYYSYDFERIQKILEELNEY